MLVSEFSKDVDNLTEPAPSLFEQANQNLRKWIKASRYPSLIVETTDQSIWVRGFVTRADEKAPLLKRLQSIYPLVLTEIQALPDDSPTVYFRVYLLELKKN